MTESSIALIETLNPVAVFQTDGGVEDIVSKLEREVRAIELDPTTEKGRKEIKSVAYKVSRSKTALDDMGKKVQADAKAVVDKVNADRRVISSRLDALRDEVRRPVDEYEAREKERVDGIRGRIAKIEELGVRLEGLDIETLQASAEEIERLKDYDFQEFSARAHLACEQTKNLISAAIIIAEKAEADRIEAERLAAEKAEADRIAALEAQKIREAEIARAAAEKVRKEAAELAERERKAAAEALERERQEAERKEREAAERIERMRREAEKEAQRAAEEKARAEEKATRDQEAAIERERQRVADEKAAQEAEDARRAANKAHRGKINREVLGALIAAGLTEEQGKAIIGAILGGNVPHVTISY